VGAAAVTAGVNVAAASTARQVTVHLRVIALHAYMVTPSRKYNSGQCRFQAKKRGE
jgi:hypothetical protein